MEKKNEHQVSNFWFGFLLGTLFVLIGGFFLGTKKGREHLKKILEVTDNLEEKIDLLMKEINNFEEKEKNSESIPSIINKIKNRLTF